MKQVFTKARKFRGTVIPAQATDYSVEVQKNKSITIFKNGKPGASFQIGDTAEYGSYNLHYLGQIIQISANSVTIEEPYKMYGKDHGRRHRLNMNQFCWRNYEFNLARITKFNQEESYYI
jgi:hypothetical protein